MKKALSEIVKTTTSDGKQLYITIVNKESELGLSYNRRLFILVQNCTFGYISQFKETDDPSNIDISKCKVIVPIQNLLQQPQRNKDILIISFYMLQNQKRVNKKWFLKMASENMIVEWQRIFTNEIEKSTFKKSLANVSKSNASPNKDSKMKISSDFIINKSPSKLIKPIQQQKSPAKQQIQKRTQSDDQKGQKILPSVQYRNELYETESKNQESGKFLNSNQFPQKSQQIYSQQPVPQQKDSNVDKQKQKIVENEQPQNSQDFVEEFSKGIKKSNENSPNNNLKPKNTSPEYDEKQGSAFKQASPSKSKVSFTKYGKLVEKVTYSKSSNNLLSSPNKLNKQNDRALEIQTVHDRLFHQEKLKFSQQKLLSNAQLKNGEAQKNENGKIPEEFGWTYRYLVKESEGKEYQIICKFSQFCSSVLKEVVEQFHVGQSKRKFLPKYRDQHYQLYEVNDVQFKIAFIHLKQIQSKDEVRGYDNVCDQTAVKQLSNEFKSFKSLYKLIKKSDLRFLRVPLCCFCQYQGFVALFKTIPQFQSANCANSDKKVQVDLQKMRKSTNFNIALLQQQSNATILKLNSDFYKQLSAELGQLHTQFSFFIIWEVMQLFPPDLFNGQKNFLSTQQFLREELFDQYIDNAQSNIKQIVSLLKKSPKIQEESEVLQKEKNILEEINNVTQQLDSLDEYFLHPSQISKIMHEKGINMRYLYLVYERSTLNFTKSYVISQIAARVCKALFRKTIQDVILEDQKDQPKTTYSEKIYYKIIDFFNCILGNSKETQFIWKVLSTHSNQYFHVPLLLQQIQKGYFLTSLVYHCGIEIDWGKLDMSRVFSSNEFWNENNFLGIKVKYKQYDPFLSEEQQNLMRKVEEEDPQAFKTFQKICRMQQSKLPMQFKNKKYLNNIRKYLSNFIPPDSTSFRELNFLNLYNKNQPFSKTQFHIKFMELKWYLRKQKKDQYISTFNAINETIILTYGDFHPLLESLYRIMSIYHRNNGQFQDAITFSKSSVISMLKICGSNHPKVGECYFHLAVCCIKANKKQQALVSLQKAKTIFETNQKQKDVAYAHVCLKLGLLFLSEQKVKESVNIVKFALSNFNEHIKQNCQNTCQNNTYEQQRVQCYQILARCYELGEQKEQQQELSSEALKDVLSIKSAANVQKLTKIILNPLLSSQPVSNTQIYLNIISMLPKQDNANFYMKSFERIHERIQEKSLVDNLTNYLENINAIENFIKENNNLKQWKTFSKIYDRETVNDFISITEEIIYFLGEGFLTGALRENL